MTVPVIRIHPFGGYAVVLMETGEPIPDVQVGYHVRFMEYREASTAAGAETDNGDYLVHEECLS